MAVIPQTLHKLNTFDCLSAMQKCIRRGMEREAMEFACELGHTSKAFGTMVGNRLQIISHEDVGLATPEVIPLVYACCQQAKEFYDPEKLGKWRMMIGTAIRAMCRAPKSREGDHFQAAIGLANELEGVTPGIPDWAYDQHTLKGRRMGRGVEHFREESTKLVPAPDRPDPYEEEACEMWAVKAEGGRNGRERRPHRPRYSTRPCTPPGGRPFSRPSDSSSLPAKPPAKWRTESSHSPSGRSGLSHTLGRVRRFYGTSEAHNGLAGSGRTRRIILHFQKTPIRV